MTRQEAVHKLATVGHLSMAHAEDLYDSFFEKPVVPQYVADWYEGNKQSLNLNLSGLVFDLATDSPIYHRKELKAWVNDNKKTFITTLVNMHQFGYEVEGEPRYMVRIKGIDDRYDVLNYGTQLDEWTIDDADGAKGVRTTHTRKELETNGFGWVFDCEGVEVKEVTNE